MQLTLASICARRSAISQKIGSASTPTRRQERAETRDETIREAKRREAQRTRPEDKEGGASSVSLSVSPSDNGRRSNCRGKGRRIAAEGSGRTGQNGTGREGLLRSKERTYTGPSPNTRPRAPAAIYAIASGPPPASGYRQLSLVRQPSRFRIDGHSTV